MNFDLNKLLAVAILFLGYTASAQMTEHDAPFSDLPPTSQYGKCYAKCKSPDVYETVSVQRVKKEATSKIEVIPARYENASEQVVVKESYTKKRVIPARYETVTERVLVKPEEVRYKTIPAKYTTESRKIMVTPARGEWVKKKKAPNCFSANPEDCYVACWEEVPAVYRTERVKVMSEPARTVENVIPAKYKTITRRVIARAEEVVEEVVPAQYKTITKKVMVNSADTREVTIPAQYETYTEKKLVAKGGYSTWTEILCAQQTTSSKVRQIQSALKANGYNPGPIDGVMGSQTKSALVRYQKDKALPIGNMNTQTLQALGVSH